MGFFIGGIVVVTLIVFLLFSKRIFSYIRKLYISRYISGITIHNIDSLSGREFEEFLYYLFINLGFEVTLTKSSHDYGADLILKVGNVRIALQCKLYSKHSVGTSSVQEAYSASKFYNTHIGVVITNSKFSSNAIKLASITNVLLWDRDMLIKLISAKDSEKSLIRNQVMYTVLSSISTV